jgi:CheY-like chemotaxis protein
MNTTRNNQSSFVLSEPALLELLRLMDQASSNGVARDRRKHVRHPHTSRDTYIKVMQPGGGMTERLVTVRDLSAGGAAILYPGYLHKGSIVSLELRKRIGGKELVQGQVQNCRHVHAAWHAVGIKFKDVIFPQLFLSQVVRNPFDEPAAVKVDLAQLKGSVLILDDQAMDRMLFVHLLKGSSLRVSEAATSQEALALVARSLKAGDEKGSQAVEPFALIVSDLNLNTESGAEVIQQIREKGYRGPVLLMTAETAPDRIAAAMAAGATALFQKPYTAEKLHAAIAAQLGEGTITVDDPLYSPLCTDPQNRIMVEKYIAQVRTTAAELRKAATEEDLAQVRKLCQTLKGTGAGYGFPSLTDAATSALVSLDASYSVSESITDLHRLDAICSRVTSKEPPPPGRQRK